MNTHLLNRERSRTTSSRWSCCCSSHYLPPSVGIYPFKKEEGGVAHFPRTVLITWCVEGLKLQLHVTHAKWMAHGRRSERGQRGEPELIHRSWERGGEGRRRSSSSSEGRSRRRSNKNMWRTMELQSCGIPPPTLAPASLDSMC